MVLEIYLKVKRRKKNKLITVFAKQSSQKNILDIIEVHGLNIYDGKIDLYKQKIIYRIKQKDGIRVYKHNVDIFYIGTHREDTSPLKNLYPPH